LSLLQISFMNPRFIQFDSITKRFAGVHALDNVSLSIARGECHAIMGENGAGKSTLGKILAGIYLPDGGRVVIDGAQRSFRSPRDAFDAGVGMVHQELAFCPDLSIAENCCLGQYPRRGGVFVNRGAMARKAQTMLAEIGVSMDVRRPMRSLSTAQEQMVQIAAAVGTNARTIVFDEPTSSLSEVEARRLFELIEKLKKRGVTMLYISHRMPEVLALCERMSVLRDGRFVGTLERKDASEDAIVKMMIGRAMMTVTKTPYLTAPPVPALRIRNLSSPGKFDSINFEVKSGEVLGLAGLVGAGRSEIAQAIFGLDPDARGEVYVEGRRLPLGNIKTAMNGGIALVPEDRKRQGLVLMMSGRENTTMASLDRFKRLGGLLARRKERKVAREFVSQLKIRTPNVETPVSALSGGNQQKFALAKWLVRDAKVLIVDEPTRGVDVGAKAAIHQLLRDLAAKGAAILLISSELPEVLSVSDRIVVLREGRQVGEISAQGATEEKAMHLMAGMKRAV
jgi:ABC-type sugar transport system ATPase subunit